MTDGNILFLVCQPCSEAGEKDFGVRLAERSRVGFYDPVVPPKPFAAWLMQHARCGGKNVDHFKLGYLNPQNSDQVIPKAIEAAINGAVN